MKRIIVLCAFLVGSRAAIMKTEGRFPTDFIFGVGSAAYQIEGAWDEDGKTESIWDNLTHKNPKIVHDGNNADVTCDSYRNYKRDVQMMRELGVQSYRMSISWPRLLPTGYSNNINPAAVEFYNSYINEILKYNITPVITLYHWDLPQSLQDLGGILNPLFADWFEDFARVVFNLLGDRVKLWITINEPHQICFGPTMPKPDGFVEYICTKNLIMANAKVYHLYDREFKKKQGGQVGYIVAVPWFSAETDSEEDNISAELQRQASIYIYSDPIFSIEGSWPKKLAHKIAVNSAAQGHPSSRLPEFTAEEKIFVHGTADFYGVNHYGSYRVSAKTSLTRNRKPTWHNDIVVGLVTPDHWPRTVFDTIPRGPDSTLNILKQLDERYPNTVFYIFESGTATTQGLDDDDRVKLFRECLQSALKALDAGISLKGYFAWSLMDSFEWRSGYGRRYGIYDVDFNDPARPRTPKKSAFVYKDIIKHRSINPDYEPFDRIMTIDDDVGTKVK